MTTATIQERAYQVEASAACFDRWTQGDPATLLILPTGTGKTVVAGMVCRRAKDEHHRRALFLAHREELIVQAQDKLGRHGLACGIEMAALEARQQDALFGPADVVIATVQTLQKQRLASWPRDYFGLVITDEAHHSRARSYRNIYDHFQGYWHLGITATPDRGDGKNLGAVFGRVAYDYPLRRAIAEGYLVPLVAVRLQTDVDLRALKTTDGDFDAAELEDRISPHVEALSAAAAAEIGARPAIVFTPDVGSAEAFADALTKLGKPAEAVSGRLHRRDRRDTLARFRMGAFQVICCCDLLVEGWDEPQVAAVAIARPTKLRSRYAQMIGRGTRPCPESGKQDCLIVDFAWETTAGHSLCTAVDLFDDTRLDDEVIAEARKLAVEKERKGEQVEMEALLDEADGIVRRLRTMQVTITGARATVEKWIYDPVGVGDALGVPLKKGWDFNPANPATPKQIQFLENLGVRDTTGLSRQGAGKLLDALVGRRAAGRATLKQVGFLVALGIPRAAALEMGFDEASETIGQLLKAQGKAS